MCDGKSDFCGLLVAVVNKNRVKNRIVRINYIDFYNYLYIK